MDGYQRGGEWGVGENRECGLKSTLTMMKKIK